MGGVGSQNVHLNQSCRKFDEMPKSTKKFFFTVWLMGGGGGGVKMFTWTKVAGNLMKCLNPLKTFHCLADGGGSQNVHLNQSCRKFDEMPKSTKKFFSLFGWWGDGGCQNVHLNQSCRKFDEMPKSTKKFFFHYLAKFFSIVWPMWRGLSKCSPEPKLQEIWWNA